MKCRPNTRLAGLSRHTPADDGFVEDGPYIDAWEARVLPDTVAAQGSLGPDSSLTTAHMTVRVYVRVLAERPLDCITAGDGKSPPVFMPNIEVEPCR